jgi:hypothetical protein
MKIRWLFAVILVLLLLKGFPAASAALGNTIPLSGLWPSMEKSTMISNIRNEIKTGLLFLSDLMDPKSKATQLLHEKVMDNVDQLGGLLEDVKRGNSDAILSNLLIKHLPEDVGNGEYAVGKKKVENVFIKPGDKNVTQRTVDRVASALTDVSLPLLKTGIGGKPQKDVSITLFSSMQSYGDALIKAGIPAESIQNYIEHTGGMAAGNQIWIPLYASHTRENLINTLTHELSHTALNEKNIAYKLPTWLNEGIAMHNGMLAMKKLDPQTTDDVIKSMNKQIEEIAHSNALLPLSADENDIVTASYNVEWVDYMAVENLIKKEGEKKFANFLDDVSRSGVNASFESHYPFSMKAYEKTFYESLH